MTSLASFDAEKLMHSTSQGTLDDQKPVFKSKFFSNTYNKNEDSQTSNLFFRTVIDTYF